MARSLRKCEMVIILLRSLFAAECVGERIWKNRSVFSAVMSKTWWITNVDDPACQEISVARKLKYTRVTV